MNNEQKLQYISERIGQYQDFPKKGILFRDIFSALTDGKACQYLKELLVQHVRENSPNIDIIVGLESRGFLFNMMIATEMGVGCVPVRKKGKLPGECVAVEYELEYGKETFELQKSAIKAGQKVLIVDDLLATGGSLAAAIKLVRKAGGEVVECLTVMELKDLEGRKKVDAKVHSLLQY